MGRWSWRLANGGRVEHRIRSDLLMHTFLHIRILPKIKHPQNADQRTTGKWEWASPCVCARTRLRLCSRFICRYSAKQLYSKRQQQQQRPPPFQLNLRFEHKIYKWIILFMSPRLQVGQWVDSAFHCDCTLIFHFQFSFLTFFCCPFHILLPSTSQLFSSFSINSLIDFIF